MRKINTYTKSREEFARAVKVIPSGVYGHLGPAEGCFIPVEAYPMFGERAKGSYFWDVDGNRFIDYMCAYGPNVLGVLRSGRGRGSPGPDGAGELHDLALYKND